MLADNSGMSSWWRLWKADSLRAGERGGGPQRVTQIFGESRLLAFNFRPLSFLQQLNLTFARQIDRLTEHAGRLLGRVKPH